MYVTCINANFPYTTLKLVFRLFTVSTDIFFKIVFILTLSMAYHNHEYMKLL